MITGVGVGGAISNVEAKVVPPPGVGLTTVTGISCDVASSATVSWKVRLVVLTKVVATDFPLS